VGELFHFVVLGVLERHLSAVDVDLVRGQRNGRDLRVVHRGSSQGHGEQCDDGHARDRGAGREKVPMRRLPPSRVELNMDNLSRKEFIVLLVGTATAAACGGSSSEGPSGNCAANGTTVQIAQNTGHVLIVSKADITAGVQKTYTMQGDPSHTHDVTLS